jgi:Leucine-rich repeat (LRR) protein
LFYGFEGKRDASVVKIGKSSFIIAFLDKILWRCSEFISVASYSMRHRTFFFLIFLTVLTSSCGWIRGDFPVTHSTTLNLSRKHLTEIPASAFEDKQIKVLKLFGNDLTTLSPRIGELENLEELYLGKNHLTTLPPEIGKLKNLKIVSISYNDFQAIPKEIGELEHLEQLWLTQNQLTSLPSEIGALKHLETLKADYNFLTEIPTQLGECTALKFVYLGRNNLKEVPSELGELRQLKELYLAGAGILVEVPETFCTLRFLEILEIDQTTALPSCLWVHQANRLRIIQK